MMCHSRLGYLTLILLSSVVGCSSNKASFDAEKAPFGDRTPTTVVHSTVQLGSVSDNAVTQVVGDKTIGGHTYSRISYASVSDPSSGVEWWIDEKPGESVTLAGWDGHSKLAQGLVPPGVVTLDQPVTVSLKTPLNTLQHETSSATIAFTGDTTPHHGQATSQYTLIDDNATVDTSMGKIYGCKRVSGSTQVLVDSNIDGGTASLPNVLAGTPVAGERRHLPSDSNIDGGTASLPNVLAGTPLSGDLWYHPSYGIVAFNSPELKLGMTMTDTSDCGAPDADGFAILRKASIVDSAHPFKVSTYDDCAKQFDADKNEHAKMLLELRWADDAKAKAGGVDTLGPMLKVEFGDIFGYFPASLQNSPVSIFHPEENGQGFIYSYAYVSQADKYMPTNGIEYHVSVGVDSGASPIRATARIYYKKFSDGTNPTGGAGGSLDASRNSGAGGTAGTGKDASVDVGAKVDAGGVDAAGGAGGIRDGGVDGAGGAGGIRDGGVDGIDGGRSSSVSGPIVLDLIAAGDLSNWTPPVVNSNPTMTFNEIVSPYDSGVALSTTATGTTLMACPVEYTARDFQLPGSISSAAYALQLYLALESNMTTYNWPGLQVDLLSGDVAVADIQYYQCTA
jgi:hypothetical protein